ncbi:homoserine kinase [Clostridium puniceum]|uniref:Homoserine kinase n=1 Tax=Clostridium puniceum TaxID=29367 RepID=A0A1S8TKM2_9CLOT|nr:phosphotransferase [Clostridium puniceum]OOM78152.1 homoserine kinase [Clostridium puniceum]
MKDLLGEALYNYEINQPQVEFIRHNENETYKIKDMLLNKQYVIRIHKSSEDFSLDIFKEDKHSIDYLTGEINILNCIRRNTKIGAQMPIKNKYGEFVTILKDGTPVTLLSWINGNTIDNIKLNNHILFKLGAMIGEFHQFSKAWSESKKISRYSYDKMLLKRMKCKLIGGLRLKAISNEQFEIIDDTINEISNTLDRLDLQKKSKGIVHSDLAKSNIIVSDNEEIIPIDFGLSGNSYYYMDLGSLFSHFNKPNQQSLILKGYKSIINEDVEIKYIEAFMVFQIILFISTHIENAYKIQWFNSAINRWSKEFFIPFLNNIRFIKNI